MSAKVKLTDAQKVALEWLPERLGGGRTHGGTICGAPPKAALKALVSRDLAAKVGDPSMDLWAITEQGFSIRSALRAEREGE